MKKLFIPAGSISHHQSECLARERQDNIRFVYIFHVCLRSDITHHSCFVFVSFKKLFFFCGAVGLIKMGERGWSKRLLVY